MKQTFLDIFSTEPVLRAQQTYYGRSPARRIPENDDAIGPDEEAFIQARDSFYLSTVNPDGWPYIQHRGGPRGFLKVLDPQTLAFADFSGNRQLLSTGHVQTNDRVALFLMDYPQQERLKIVGHAEVLPGKSNSDLVAELTPTGVPAHKVERIFRIKIAGLSWNCSQHITPRFTADEIENAVAPLHRRIAELETALAAARGTTMPIQSGRISQ